MHIKKIAWRFFFVCFFITTIALWFTTWYSVHIYKKELLKATIDDVLIRGNLLIREFSSFDISQHRSLDSLCKIISSDISTRITVILPSGKVIADSDMKVDSMENHANRPEIIMAQKEGQGSNQRYSTTLKEQMLYVALPMTLQNQKGILRLSVSLSAIRSQEKLFYIRLIVASMVVFLVLVGASYLLSQHISTPIYHIKNGARRFAAGDFSSKISIPSSEELGELAHALNLMAESLDERIQTITRQRNELNAILQSMSEGVIAVNSQKQVLWMNPAAAKLTGVPGLTEGKRLPKLIRNSELNTFSSQVLSGGPIKETTFILYRDGEEFHFKVSGTISGENSEGTDAAVFVFNDITRIRQLEIMRKEFVSNVSHELRTPLTSIKGFIETILSGNYNFPDEVFKFLQIVSSKTDRLCSIIDDILSLSSIERDHEYGEIYVKESDIKTVIDDAIKMCSIKASEKNISIDASMVAPLRFNMNAQLIEQALTNLIENAIKYSEAGKLIIISAIKSTTDAVISVKDQGIGIAPEHLDRVFERFYRVDKSRSRKMGGTGLGLSIVKNIALAHGGKVLIQSEPGKGSTFSIVLPIAS